MLSVKRIRSTQFLRHAARGLVLAFAVAAAGCSANVTRFDFPAFGLADKNDATGSLPPSQAAARPTPGDLAGAREAPRGAGLAPSDTGRTYNPPPSYSSAPLPPTADRSVSYRGYGQSPPPPPATVELAPAPNRIAARAPSPERSQDRPRAVAGGETIVVQQGDTLYGLAKRHGVSIAALIEVNGLQSGATIKPGQQLTLPSGAAPPRTVAMEPATRTPPRTARYAPAAAAPAPASGWDGRYTMKPGDSLYAIARRHKVTLNELQRVNGISDPTKVRAGTVLHVPGAGESPAEPAAPPLASTPPPATAPRVVHQGPATAGQPRVLNSPVNAGAEPAPETARPAEPMRVASRGDTATDAAAAGPARFRWPVTGRVIAGFGKRPDGTHNDGINLAVPQGTQIHAAESGRVAYAGNELKGYGNLILIRHDNGWVSAYAHNEELLVKRDDVVRRGQVIARAGKTGTVDQPQVHFELRQGAKPVDPLPHLERN